MKNIEEKAKAYADGVIECNPQHEESKGLIHTAYIKGVQDATNESPWRSVEDELPQNDQDVITFSKLGTCIGYFDKDDNIWYIYGYGSLNVTNWTPIPEPPKRG